MLQDSLRQFSSHRAVCKQWSVIIAVTILVVGALGRLNTPSLLLLAAPLLLLGMAEVGYAAWEKRCAELLRGGKGSEQSVVLSSESGLATLRRVVRSMFLLSVWPFYLVLWGVFVASAFYLPRYLPTTPAAPVANTANPSQSAFPNGFSNMPTYPTGIMPRYPSGAPNYGPFPGYPGAAARTPSPGFSRPLTPYPGPKPLARPPGTTPGGLPLMPTAAPTTPLPRPSGTPSAPP